MPCIRDGLLAPTDKQRMMYAEWLHVFGRTRAHIPMRLAAAIDTYQVLLDLFLRMIFKSDSYFFRNRRRPMIALSRLTSVIRWINIQTVT